MGTKIVKNGTFTGTKIVKNGTFTGKSPKFCFFPKKVPNFSFFLQESPKFNVKRIIVCSLWSNVMESM